MSKRVLSMLLAVLLLASVWTPAFAEESPEEPAPTEEAAPAETEEAPAEPTDEPEAAPTEDPADEPTEEPAEPTEEPAEEPEATEGPAEPTEEPAEEPSAEPEGTEEPEVTEEPAAEEALLDEPMPIASGITITYAGATEQIDSKDETVDPDSAFYVTLKNDEYTLELKGCTLEGIETQADGKVKYEMFVEGDAESITVNVVAAQALTIDTAESSYKGFTIYKDTKKQEEFTDKTAKPGTKLYIERNGSYYVSSFSTGRYGSDCNVLEAWGDDDSTWWCVTVMDRDGDGKCTFAVMEMPLLQLLGEKDKITITYEDQALQDGAPLPVVPADVTAKLEPGYSVRGEISFVPGTNEARLNDSYSADDKGYPQEGPNERDGVCTLYVYPTVTTTIKFTDPDKIFDVYAIDAGENGAVAIQSGDKVTEKTELYFLYKNAGNKDKYMVVCTDELDVSRATVPEVSGLEGRQGEFCWMARIPIERDDRWNSGYSFTAVATAPVTWKDDDGALVCVRYVLEDSYRGPTEIYSSNYMDKDSIPTSLPILPAGYALEVIVKAGYKLEGVPAEDMGFMDDGNAITRVYRVSFPTAGGTITLSQDPTTKFIPVNYVNEENFIKHGIYDDATETEKMVIGPEQVVPGMSFQVSMKKGYKPEVAGCEVTGRWGSYEGDEECVNFGILVDKTAESVTITAVEDEGYDLEVVCGESIPAAQRAAAKAAVHVYHTNGPDRGVEIAIGQDKVFDGDYLLVEVDKGAPYAVSTEDGWLISGYYEPKDTNGDGKLTLVVDMGAVLHIKGDTKQLIDFDEGYESYKDGDIVAQGDSIALSVNKSYAISVSGAGEVVYSFYECRGSDSTVYRTYYIEVTGLGDVTATIKKSSAKAPSAIKVTYKGAAEGVVDRSDKYCLPGSALNVGLKDGYYISGVSGTDVTAMEVEPSTVYESGSYWVFLPVNAKAKSVTVTIAKGVETATLKLEGGHEEQIVTDDDYEDSMLPGGTFSGPAAICVKQGYVLNIVSGGKQIGGEQLCYHDVPGDLGYFYYRYHVTATAETLTVKVVEDKDPHWPLKLTLQDDTAGKAEATAPYYYGDPIGDAYIVDGNAFYVLTNKDYTVAIDGANYLSAYTYGDFRETTFSAPADAEALTAVVRPKTLATPAKATLASDAKGLKISWTGVDMAEKYRILYKTSKSGSWKKLTDVDGAQTEYVWEKAKSNTTYYVTIQCLRSDGKTTDSSYDKTGVSLKYVAAPKAPTAAIADSGIKISWKKVSGASYYQVYEIKDGAQVKLGSPTKSTSYTWKDATANEAHVFAVQCTNKDGSAANSVIGAESAPITIVAAPEDVKAENTAAGVEISWKAVAGAVKYQVYYRTSTKKSWSKLGEAQDAAVTSYPWAKAKKGTTYYFAVRCVTAGGAAASPYSASVTRKYLAKPAAPTVALASTGIKISWKKVTGASKYQLYYKDGTGDWTELTLTKSTSYTWKEYASLTAYEFAVEAVNGAHVSARSEASASFTAVAAPQNVKAENAVGGVKISWDAVNGAELYRVYYATKKSGSLKKVADVTSDKTEYVWSKAKKGSTYYYVVRCMTADGTAAASPYSSPRVARKYVAAPTVKATAVSTGIKLSWGKSAGASKYQVYYKEGAGEWTKLTLTKSTSYTWKAAEAGVAYTFTAEATDSKGSALSARKEDGATLTIAAKPVPEFDMTEGGLKMTWTKDSVAAKYQIYYGTKKSSLKKLAMATEGEYVWAGAKRGKTYYFSVRPLTESGAVAGPYAAKGVKYTVPKA